MKGDIIFFILLAQLVQSYTDEAIRVDILFKLVVNLKALLRSLVSTSEVLKHENGSYVFNAKVSLKNAVKSDCSWHYHQQ